MIFAAHPVLIWFILGFILLLAEVVIPVFIFLFFGIGAWIVALALLVFPAITMNTQLTLFILTSVFTLVLFHKKGKSFFKGRIAGQSNEADRIGSVVGKHAVVVEDIEPNTFSGKVDFYGTQWQAISAVAIKKGVTVVIIEKNNLTLKVKPLI